MCLASWGGHFLPNAVGGLLCLALGTLLYNQHKQNWHKTHNTQQPTRWAVPPYPKRLCPLLSMGRAAAPPNHGAAAPQCRTQGASHRACARCRWFACLGGRNERHRKIERGGNALALGGCCFINYTQQSNKSWRRQWRGSWGGCATRAECGGGCHIVTLVVELIDKN
jgi:hypothetical protein